MQYQVPTIDKNLLEVVTNYCDCLRKMRELRVAKQPLTEVGNKLLTFAATTCNILSRGQALCKEIAIHFNCCLNELVTYHHLPPIYRRMIAEQSARSLVREVEKLLSQRKTLNGLSDNETRLLTQYEDALLNIATWSGIELPAFYISRRSAEKYQSLPRGQWELFFKQLHSGGV